MYTAPAAGALELQNGLIAALPSRALLQGVGHAAGNRRPAAAVLLFGDTSGNVGCTTICILPENVLRPQPRLRFVMCCSHTAS